MQNIFISAIIFFSVILQTSLLPNFFASGMIPDITLIIIIIWTAKFDFNSVLKWAILAGVMVDLVSFWPIGTDVLSFVVIAFAVNSISKRFLVPHFAWKFSVLMLMVFGGTLLNSFTVFALMKIASELNRTVEPVVMNNNLFLKSIFDVVVFVIIYWPVERLGQIFAYHNNRIMVKR